VAGKTSLAEVSASATRRLDVGRLPDHLDRLYRAAYGLCGSREEADDLVQETYARVLRRPRFLRQDKDIAYLLRVLRNTFVEFERRKAMRRTTPLSAEAIEWAQDADADPIGSVLESRAAFAAISELTPPLRDTIVAVDVAGLSYKEAARALGVRQGTIMSRLHRARERVAEVLDVLA
jgi:RNA polymerase sigma-70 factor, ECF subfamily